MEKNAVPDVVNLSTEKSSTTPSPGKTESIPTAKTVKTRKTKSPEKKESTITYKEKLHESMLRLAGDERVVFIGQGLLEDEPFYGTLTGIDKTRMLEMPCAEILSTGTAIGLALTGWIPVLLFQRMDFMLLAADQLINHAALFPEMSGGKIRVPMIIRACIGSSNTKFEVGWQHNKDFRELFRPYMKMYECNAQTIEQAFQIPTEMTMTIEWKDNYNEVV